jgi:hypothetical protein
MKALLTTLGIAGGAYWLLRARGRNRPFSEKSAVLAGRIAALSLVMLETVKCQLLSTLENMRFAQKESVKAWKSSPRVSFRLK